MVLLLMDCGKQSAITTADDKTDSCGVVFCVGLSLFHSYAGWPNHHMLDADADSPPGRRFLANDP